MSALGSGLIAGAMALGAADWVAVWRGARRAEYVLKPATMVLLIAGAIALGQDDPSLRFGLTLAALCLSLAGDVFLMLPADMFVAGLGSFLGAHLAYVGALMTSPPPWLAIAVAVAIVGSVSVAVFVPIRAGILEAGRRELALPVAVYVAALSATVIAAAAALFRLEWGVGAAWLVLTGAALFYASDGLIGWTRFVRPVPAGRVLIMATYHAGQALLVLGLLGA